jgi:hypothetical protein
MDSRKSLRFDFPTRGFGRCKINFVDKLSYSKCFYFVLFLLFWAANTSDGSASARDVEFTRYDGSSVPERTADKDPGKTFPRTRKR